MQEIKNKKESNGSSRNKKIHNIKIKTTQNETGLIRHW